MRAVGRGISAVAALAIGGSVIMTVPSFAFAAPVEGNIVINEIESSVGIPGDWIEFYNKSAESADLSGYIVKDDDDDHQYVIPAGTTVAAGGYLVLDELNGSEGHFDFGLGNGDSVRLFAPDGSTLVTEQIYPGHASTTYGLNPAGGLVETAVPSKGTMNNFTGIVINEVNYDDAFSGSVDAVELYNAGSASVAIGGWSLHDDKDRPGEGEIPAGTEIAPGEYFVMTGDDVDFTFGLGKGDQVRLKDASGNVVEAMAYENTSPTMIFARCPDGIGTWQHATELTLGAANNCDPVEAAEAALVLNEIDSGPADWLEFVNPGGQALDISGYEIRDNADDHRWRFPAGSSIQAGEYLLVEASTQGLIYNDQTQGWDENTFEAAIGIGSGDSIRVYEATGALIQEHSWTEHAAIDGDAALATLGRCPDATGEFALAHPTPGAANECVTPAVAINEIESNGGTPGDWVEIINIGDTPVDISGWTVMDNDPIGHANDVTPLAEGTVLEPGALHVFEELSDFDFGLGNGDTATVRDAAGQTVDEHVYDAHAAGTLSRCPDGTGEFVDTEVSTKGQLNACGNPVVLNEVESSDADGGDDWIELYNPRLEEALDVSGLVIRDNDDSHSYEIPAGTSIAAGEYLVLTESEFGFGLGGNDSVRIFEGENIVEETSWSGHAEHTWGRCPSATGNFAATSAATPGALNACPGIPAVEAWTGADEVTVLDPSQMFLEDSSGLDFHDGSLWAVDNGTGMIWQLDAAVDGSVSFAEGWEDGKRVRFQKDAADASAAGPDAEGITLDGSGTVYLAVERDNSDKGTNFNAILEVDPSQAGPDIVADAEWDLTDSLPAVSANMGIEAVEWVPNSVVEGAIVDANTGSVFDASVYPDAASGGVFFVALEDNGHVYAYVLNEDGSAVQIADLDPKIGGAMGLDYDSVLGVLWVEADDGYNGRLAQLKFNGTSEPQVAHIERPASMPNLNNEGFATSPVEYCVDGQRPAWWFADGETPEALRTAPLDCVVEDEDDVDAGNDANGADSASGDDNASGDDSASGDKPNADSEDSLAQTGADGLTWLLIAGGVLIAAGLVLFFVRRKSNTKDASADE